MRKRLCKFNGVAVVRKTRGIGHGGNRSAGGLGSIVVCERKLEARSLVEGQRKRTRPVGVGRHRGSKIGMGVSCRDSGEPGRRTKLELGRSKSFEDHHGAATFRTAPKRARFLGSRCLLFYLRGIAPSS